MTWVTLHYNVGTDQADQGTLNNYSEQIDFQLTLSPIIVVTVITVSTSKYMFVPLTAVSST